MPKDISIPISSQLNRISLFLPIFLFCLISDQSTKLWAQKVLSGGEIVELFGGHLRLSYIENPYGFLGILTHLPAGIREFLLLGGVTLALALSCWFCFYRRTIAGKALVFWAMLLAGGFSNLLDRLIQEIGVVDFISFSWGSSHTGQCNLADIYILLGGFCLGFLLARKI
ncbi:signal peptidase II [Desulfotalea psychrophila]|uniref:Uncharacterized protein n=1 Tax=Desulfotalea psychrophila (strain LSv54 / DSM 12343) TaxID=177439 RepID=Q6AJI5_DESPS|nr:signal peptidase II [Desulfotalea psychrophila]CAG37495.1 hypothetical protein DP2766 [Desulfotalea psychrophila LSv54]